MKVWEALVTMTAVKCRLSEVQYIKIYPKLVTEARRALRAIGTTNEEIESEFPETHLQEGLDLLVNNPAEFQRQAQIAMQAIIGNN